MVSRRHITTNRDRKSRKYTEKHRQLEREVYAMKNPDKITRHRAASLLFRTQGGP